jgi:hypothetical protein
VAPGVVPAIGGAEQVGGPARCRLERFHLIKEEEFVGVDSDDAVLAMMAHLNEPLVWLLTQSAHRKDWQVTHEAVGA